MEDSKKPLVFTNTIESDPVPPPHNATTIIQNFTATGRPFNPSNAQTGSGLDAMNTADSMGGGMLNILPRRYNDDSLISIPVLPPESVIAVMPKSPTSPLSPLSPTTPTSPDSLLDSSPNLTPTSPTQISLSYHPTTQLVYADLYSGSNSSDPTIIHEKPSNGLKFWHRRKSSTSNSNLTPNITPKPKPPPLFRTRRSTSGNGSSKGPEFVMKQVTRGEYLKHYAKDEQGRYIGSEDPAGDCILRDERDVRRWRGGNAWKNEL